MESFEFIESAIIFGLDNKKTLREFRYTPKDFAKFGEIYTFIVNHFDTYGSFPSPDVLVNNYEDIGLHPEAQSVNFDYALDCFTNQVMHRQVVSAIRGENETVKENPKQAVSSILSKLSDIELDFDEDVTVYDEGTLDRFEEWKLRAKKREMGEGLLGIPTSFQSINSTGVGWMPGELVALFARPTVGKTWMCVHSAVTAIQNNIKTLLVSTEMPTSAINLRIDVVMAQMNGYKFSHRALRTGSYIEEDKYKEILEQTANDRSLLVCDHIPGSPTISLNNIASLIRKHSPEFVIVDGVYLISTAESTKNKAIWEQNHSLFYGLKNICLSMDTSIMVSTQANRDASNRFAPPRADQVAFGDALIRASDVAFGMCALEDDEKKRLFQCEKYRDGVLPSDQTVFEWDVDAGRIFEIPDYNLDGDF